MRRVIAYVDGFNLYHAIDDLKKPHLKWVDLWQLAAGICGKGETLTQVYYFTAIPTWRPADVIGRHREYIKALTHVGVSCVIGHFKQKHRECWSCGATWIEHEEKETDVMNFGHGLNPGPFCAPPPSAEAAKGGQRRFPEPSTLGETYLELGSSTPRIS
jgi:hypothetical protein